MKRIVEEEFDAAFEEVDVIIAPSSAIPAPLLGESEVEVAGKKQALAANAGADESSHECEREPLHRTPVRIHRFGIAGRDAACRATLR